jgi:hypothetical protein
MSNPIQALNALRHLLDAMAPGPAMSTSRRDADIYSAGFRAGQARAIELLECTRVAYAIRPHQWVIAQGTDAATGEVSALPFHVCAACRRRSDGLGAELSCAPLTPLELAQWAEVDAAFAAAQQAMAGRRETGGL